MNAPSLPPPALGGLRSNASTLQRFNAPTLPGLLAATLLVLGSAASPAQSQRPAFESHTYSLKTGVHANETTEPRIVFSKVIEAPPDTPTFRINFSAVNLGSASTLTLVSLQDGGQQRLDRISLGYWQNTSAIFNGHRVLLELHVAPGDEGVFAEVDALLTACNCGGKELSASAANHIMSLCGADSRVASTDNRVGRINGCTAWLVSNGAVLTAGHCGPVSGVFSVNVPASSASGVAAASAPEDQYPIDLTRRTSVDNGKGDDYTVFGLLPNTTTGTLPHQRLGFFRMTREAPAAGTTIRVTGFGVDNSPNGPVANCCATDSGGNCTHPNCNAQNRTLQTATGPYVGETVTSATDIFHAYQTDTEPANSGSPIIWNVNGFTIGIHTHGGCTGAGTGDNDGTSFENTNLENLIAAFPGANTRYVDVVQPPNAPAENGTIFQPFNTVTEAVASVVSGGRICIVEGSYTRAAGNTMTMGADGKSFTLLAPVGAVTIGN
jgi:V8-like Glu-specific endopeptidase